jgi:p-hydroxybenzoate 3-monooxygenase
VRDQETVDVLGQAGVGERLAREGLVHEGIELRWEGRAHRVPMTELTGSRAITVYGQTEVVKDLLAARG